MTAALERAAELVIHGGIVVTMARDRPVWFEGGIAVAGPDIIAVGDADELRQAYPDAEMLECHDKLIIPGLINAHTHAPMSLLRGLADDLRLDVWLHGYMLPVEREFVDAEFCRIGTQLSCIEMIRSGVTCFLDLYYFEDEVARTAAEVGLRAICAETIMKYPTPNAPSYDQALAYSESFIQRWLGHDLIIPAVGPHSPYMCTPEILLQAHQLALRYDVLMHTHLAETQLEVEESKATLGLSPIAYMANHGFLQGKVLAAHCVHLSPDEFDLLAEWETGVAHNPTSNLKLASGVAQLSRLVSKGIHVGVGTDGCASNNDQDMFEELRLAALLPKGTTFDPTALPARRAFALATIEAARAAHVDHLVGSLEPGKRADLAVIDLNQPHLTPRFELSDDNVFSHLVYATKAADVCHVMVNGRWLMRDRKLLTVDAEEVMREAQDIARQVGVFLKQRERDLLDKTVAIGGVKRGETYEVQVKVQIDDWESVAARLKHPAITIVKESTREQYDTYFLFVDKSKGRLRYREDNVLSEGEDTKPIYTLTIIGPTAEEKDWGHSILLSRSRFSTPANRSLRFYREYFQPDQIREVAKWRRRYRIRYKGLDFAINFDTLNQPTRPQTYLEIKSRTWSERDARRKAELITELLDLLEVKSCQFIKDEYVDLV